MATMTAITSLTDDNICNILLNLNVIQFICLLTTCKQFYEMRKTALKFLRDGKDYPNYDSKAQFISTFLNSYINYYAINLEPRLQPGCKYDKTKIKNTVSIIGYHCTEDNKLHEIYKTNDQLLTLCCKAICRKFRYKYSHPYHRLYRLFWFNWHQCCVSIWDICELVYHIKNRKYKNVLNVLSSMTFRESATDNLIDTLSYLVSFIQTDEDNKYVAVIICLMYMYISQNASNIKISGDFKKVIIDKGYDHIESLKQIDEYPKYLQKYIINQITTAIHYLE